MYKKKETNEIQMKRRTKELALLKGLPQGYKFSHKEINIGLLIQIEIEKDLIPSNILDPNIKKYFFHIILDFRFPFHPPRISARTTFTKPSLADGRDLCTEIITKEWTPSLTLFEIVQKIPRFIADIVQSQNSSEEPLKIYGYFHLGEIYDINDWMTMPCSAMFNVREVVKQEKKQVEEPRYLVVSESAVLLFEPEEKKKNFCTLVFWATLHTLQKIKRNLDFEKYATFTWRATQNEESFDFTLYIEEAGTALELIIKNMKEIGVGVDKSNNQNIDEFDVSLTAVSGINIESLLAEIMIYENKVDIETNLANIQYLMNLYQKAVEYYSAINDPQFSTFLQKLHSLLKKNDVQTILQQQNQKEEEKKNIIQQKEELRQLEIERNLDENPEEKRNQPNPNEKEENVIEKIEEDKNKDEEKKDDERNESVKKQEEILPNENE